MNNLKFRSTLAVSFALTLLFISCKNDNDNEATPPISNGVAVTINNTFQSTAFGLPNETPIESIFQVEAGSLFATATVSEALEFDNYLLNLYDVDIDENSITYTLVAPTDSETYGDIFRIIEAGTVDRYYLNFASPQNVNGFTSNNPSVSLRIDSATTLVVEISEGFNFNPGTTFTISLD
jgi:hypothetical protein